MEVTPLISVRRWTILQPRMPKRVVVRKTGLEASTETSGHRADEKDGSPGKFETHRRNQVQLTVNANARCERVIQTIKHECLKHFLIFGQKHLDYLLSRFVEHYNQRRANSSLQFRPPACEDPPAENNDISLHEIVCRKDLGSVIKSFERRAA